MYLYSFVVLKFVIKGTVSQYLYNPFYFDNQTHLDLRFLAWISLNFLLRGINEIVEEKNNQHKLCNHFKNFIFAVPAITLFWTFFLYNCPFKSNPMLWTPRCHWYLGVIKLFLYLENSVKIMRKLKINTTWHCPFKTSKLKQSTVEIFEPPMGLKTWVE